MIWWTRFLFFSIDDYYDDPDSVDCEPVINESQVNQYAYNEGCSQDLDTMCVVGSQCGVKGLLFHVQGLKIPRPEGLYGILNVVTAHYAWFINSKY